MDQTIVDQFLKLDEGKNTILLDIMITFLENTSSLMTKTEIAIQTKDYQVAKQTLHTIKGSSGSIGALPVSSVAKEMEQAVINKLPEPEIVRLFDSLKNEMDKLKKYAVLDLKLPINC